MERNSALLYVFIMAACAVSATTVFIVSIQGPVYPDEIHMDFDMMGQGYMQGEGMMRQRTSTDIVKNVLTAVDIVLLGAIIVIYVGVLRQMRSRLAMGMLIFSMAMLAQVVSSNPELHHIMGFTPSGLGPFEYLPDVFVTAALSVLVYLSLE